MNILITGATSGIGEALVLAYSLQGHHVIACGRNPAKLEALLQKSQGNLTTLCFDITNAGQITQQIADAPPIDIAILNAGDCEYIDDVLNFDAELFERVIKVNLVAMGYLLQNIIPKMIPSGQIGLMSSSVTYLPFARAQAYGASKAGVDYLAKSLALELNKHDIGVSLIQPGFIKTPLTDKNDFDMPFIISAEEAAQRIIKGLSKKQFLIAFPKRFIVLMKVISWLPRKFWYRMQNK